MTDSSFVYEIDPMPNWFYKHVHTNEIFLCEGYCIVYTSTGGKRFKRGALIGKKEFMETLNGDDY